MKDIRSPSRIQKGIILALSDSHSFWYLGFFWLVGLLLFVCFSFFTSTQQLPSSMMSPFLSFKSSLT